MKTLNYLQTGSSAVIKSLAGGDSFLCRITSMGFVPETPIVVVRNGRSGPLLVSLRDTNVALGRGEAAKIMVEESV